MKPLLALVAAVSLGFGVLACGGSSKGASPAAHVSSNSGAASGASASTGGTSAGRAASSAATATTVAANTPTSGHLKGDEDDDDTAANTTPDNSTGDNDADFDNDLKGNVGKGYLDSDDSPVTHFGHAATGAERQAIASVAKRYYTAALAADGATACRLMYSLLEEAIPEDYGSGAGPAYARGKTCSVVMTKIFRHEHSLLTGDFKVTAVRIKGKTAYALLGSHTQAARYLNLHAERGAWKVEGLLAGPLP